MLMFMLRIGLMLSVQMIVILLMLGLLFFLGSAPPASPKTVLVADPGMDWLRLIQITTHLDHHHVRLLLNLLAASIIPLLTWLLANSVAKPYRGVKR